MPSSVQLLVLFQTERRRGERESPLDRDRHCLAQRGRESLSASRIASAQAGETLQAEYDSELQDLFSDVTLVLYPLISAIKNSSSR